jgi:hypothetical protein
MPTRGNRGGREPKKPKKEAMVKSLRKATESVVLPPVEVVRKRRPERDEQE